MLYCTYVRPHLEFAIECPYFTKGIDELEKIQHKATKLIPERRHLDCRKRLILRNQIIARGSNSSF